MHIPFPPTDWVTAANTYGDPETFRRSAVTHIRGTRNGKAQVTLKAGPTVWLDMSYADAKELITGEPLRQATSWDDRLDDIPF